MLIEAAKLISLTLVLFSHFKLRTIRFSPRTETAALLLGDMGLAMKFKGGDCY